MLSGRTLYLDGSHAKLSCLAFSAGAGYYYTGSNPNSRGNVHWSSQVYVGEVNNPVNAGGTEAPIRVTVRERPIF